MAHTRSLSLVPIIFLDILMICFARFAYCGRWDVKVWHKGKPKSGYLSVSVKQETTRSEEHTSELQSPYSIFCHIAYHFMSPHCNPITLRFCFAPIAETITPLFCMRLRWLSQEAAFSQDRSSKSLSHQDAYESKLI